jgi:hypothetical protein
MINLKKNIMFQKEVTRTRHSNREYPLRFCEKPDCNLEFIPIDGRQIYCNAQHRIDSNNDKRKIVDKIESDFNKRVRNNKQILKKIKISVYYIKNGYTHLVFLEHENYDFGSFHRVVYNEEYKREISYCYEYGIMMIDAEKKQFLIFKNE